MCRIFAPTSNLARNRSRIAVDSWTNQVEITKHKPRGPTLRQDRQPFRITPFVRTSSTRVIQNKLNRKARVRLQETSRQVLATIPLQEDIKLKRKLCVKAIVSKK